ALWIMYQAGWVHRDVSGGNISWFTHGNMGLLGDFKYIVRINEERRHDVRTGTPFFMAAETMKDAYLFMRLQRNQRKLRTRNTTPNFDSIRKPKPDLPIPVSKSKLPFSYNPLHDLESVWWIIVYILFFDEDEVCPCRNPESCQTMMNELFHGQLEFGSRLFFLRDMSQGHMVAVEKCLSSSFAPAVKLLAALASILVDAYEDSESTTCVRCRQSDWYL
ncbi:hypothetical protein FB446DRAFT_651015, partial [Lentinula raphanica]